MVDGQTIQISASEAFGLSGAILYSVGYVLSAYDKLPSQSPIYYATKLLAAVLVLISLVQDFNLASAVIQVFFITVSLVGIIRHFSPQRRGQAYRTSQHAPGGGAPASSGFAPVNRPLAGVVKAQHPYARPDR
ncbi:MAG: hypothetical protein AAF718_05890 [Pseudomonadota bacterium]